MTLFDSLSSNISNIFSKISDFISEAGPKIAEFANNIKPVLGPILTTISALVPHPAVKTLASCANAVLNGLAIFHKDENVQDMGDRALQAAANGVTSDNFDNFDDYIEELRKFELNPEASNKYSEAEKLIAGLGLGTAAIEEKFKVEAGSLSNIWLLPITNPSYFTAEKIQTIIENGGLTGDINTYLDRSMNSENATKFENSLKASSIGETMDNSEISKLYDALDTAKSKFSELKNEIKEGV